MAARFALSLAVLLVGAFALSIDIDDKAWKTTPIQKVVTLLKDMSSQLEKEQGEDEDVYDKMSCWCETGDKAKTKAISDAEQRTSDLNAAVEELTAKSQQLNTDIAEAEREITEKNSALATAEALRSKEGSEFHETEKDAIQAIGGLKSAVQTLGNVHSGALTQETMMQIRNVITKHFPHVSQRGVLKKLGLAPSQLRAATNLLQAPGAAALQEDYAPQSSQIFGVMKGMQESFEANLAKETADEKTAQNSYAEMKVSKSQELAAAQEGLDNKQQQLADTDSKNEDSKEDLVDTGAQLDADRVYLADLKERCGAMDQQFAERSKMRNEEIQAVSEALEILTNDEARDTMSRATSLVQTSVANSGEQRRALAIEALRKAARKLSSPQLSALAVTLNSDVFSKVKESIDTMITQLKGEQQAEVEKRDWCKGELHQNEMQTSAKYEEKDDVQTTIDNLSNLVQNGKAEIAAAKEEINTAKIEMKRASENRQAENIAYQNTVQDQRATQAILSKAKERLQAVYSKDKAALVQAKTSAGKAAQGQAPPPGFKTYKKAGGAGGVIGMMDQVISESAEVEAEAKHGEQAAQAAYEKFAADTKDEIAALNNEVADKTERMAKADADLVRANEDFATTGKDLETLDSYSKNLHGECDYILNDFEVRQTSRGQEVEALQQAKQVLSGGDM